MDDLLGVLYIDWSDENVNIGFDVDGVLVNISEFQLKYGKKYFEKRGIQISNQQGFDIKDIFNCTNEEREKFWIKYIWKYCLTEPMTIGAAEISKKLRDDGHKITIVTGRAHTTESGSMGKLFRWMLRHWLKKNGFIYDEIFYCSEKGSADEKTRICLDNNIDVLIDDKPEILLSLKDRINIICYTALCNEEIDTLDNYRVTDMDELYDALLALERNM